MPPDLLWLSLRAASAATGASLIVGVWLGYTLQQRPRAAALVSIPLLFPPTIVCVYFLAPHFTWPLAAAAGMLQAAPLLGRSARAAFAAAGSRYTQVAQSMGASGWRIFWRIALPLSARPILAAAGVAFARVAAECALVMAIAQHSRI